MTFRQALRIGRRASYDWQRIKPQHVAFLQHAGGMNGFSKGAIPTHRNLVANVIQIDAWTKPKATFSAFSGDG